MDLPLTVQADILGQDSQLLDLRLDLNNWPRSWPLTVQNPAPDPPPKSMSPQSMTCWTVWALNSAGDVGKWTFDWAAEEACSFAADRLRSVNKRSTCSGRHGDASSADISPPPEKKRWVQCQRTNSRHLRDKQVKQDSWDVLLKISLLFSVLSLNESFDVWFLRMRPLPSPSCRWVQPRQPCLNLPLMSYNVWK